MSPDDGGGGDGRTGPASDPENSGRGGGNDGGDDRRRDEGDDQGPPTTVERVVIVVSTLFTLALFGYVLWQATVASTAVAPAATVVGTTELPDGRERVEVAVRNDQQVGIASVTVAVHCTSPPARMTFEHVPVDGRRTGFVVCPPGTGTPRVTVTGWQEA